MGALQQQAESAIIDVLTTDGFGSEHVVNGETVTCIFDGKGAVAGFDPVDIDQETMVLVCEIVNMAVPAYGQVITIDTFEYRVETVSANDTFWTAEVIKE